MSSDTIYYLTYCKKCSYSYSQNFTNLVGIFFRKIFKLDPDNVLRYNASKHHVWYLLPSVHGLSDGVGTGSAAQPGLRGGVSLRHGHHGSPHHCRASLPVLSVGGTIPTR